MSWSQFLTVIGLIFEFASTWIILRKVFKSPEERLKDRYGIIPRTWRGERREGMWVALFLITGLLLQAIAVFIP